MQLQFRARVNFSYAVTVCQLGGTNSVRIIQPMVCSGNERYLSLLNSVKFDSYLITS